jgi:hypothetical protein
VQCLPITITQVSSSRECHWSHMVGNATEYNLHEVMVFSCQTTVAFNLAMAVKF